MLHFFKYILMSLLFIGAYSSMFSQVYETFHKGGIVKVNSGTELYIIGDYTDSSTVNKVINLGDIYFKGDITNKGTLKIFGTVNTDGRAHMIGSSSEIKGTDNILFHDLELNFDTDNDALIANKFVVINDQLLLTNGDVLLNDSIVFIESGVSSTNSGIINESTTNRIYGQNVIIIRDVSWNNPTYYNYNALKNVGISAEILDYLGTKKPTIYRYNFIQECGSNEGSVNRTFEIKNLDPDTSTYIDNISVKFHDPAEIGFLTDMDSMHVYYSNNNRDTWTDLRSTSSYGIGSADNSARQMELNNETFITAAKDSCGYTPFIQFNHLNTNVVPTDTIYGVTEVQSCDFADVNIQVIGDPGDFLWYKPDGTTLPSDSGNYNTFGDIGTYTMVLTDRRGCIGTKDLIITQAPNANADFEASSANMCFGTAFDFIPDSNQNSLYTYEWDLDDDGIFETNSYQVSNYVFSSAGSKKVSLRVTTDKGCSVSSDATYTILPIPIASFTATSACPGDDVTFDNNSTVSFTGGVDLNWDFDNNGVVDATTSGGNSGTGTNGNINFAFPSEGSYTVTLTASSNGCNSLPYSDVVTIYPAPVPDFTFTNACEGQAVQFSNNSSITDGTALTYLWDFISPGGPSSVSEDPSFSYATANAYSVTLEATSVNSCKEDTVILVSIDENPIADFSFTNECINTDISFADLSTVGGGTAINMWNWDFDNTNTSTSQNNVEAYATAGTYNVSLTVETVQGCSAETTKTLTVFDGPSVSYTVNNQCVSNAVNPVNTSTNSVSYLWDVPSLSQTSILNNPTFNFSSSGWKIIELEATSPNGCVGNFTDSVEIYALPNIGLGATNTTCGTSYILDASDNGNNAGSTYFWNTGATTPQFTATYSGSFDVTVTSSTGCISNESTTVTLNSLVEPNISDESECDLVTLDAGYPGSTYSWTGPSGFTSNAQSIDITTLGTSTYSVSVTDQNGCIGSASANVTVSTSTAVALGVDQIKCVGDVVTLDAGTPGSTYAWSTGETTQTIDVSQDGYYSVILTNAANCVSGDTIQFTFNDSPTIELGIDDDYCLEHTLNAFSANASYLWNDLSVLPSLDVTSSGQYFVEVTNTITNCVAYDTINLVINPLPVFELGNDTILCSYQDVLIESGISNANYSWNTGQTTQDITVGSTGFYSLEVTDVNGCSSTDNINVIVNPIFAFDLGVDIPFCEGASLVLELDTVFNNASYSWSTNDGIVSNADSYSVADTGVIYLDITNQFGCEASDSINILPSNLSLHAMFLADSKVTLGDSLIFIDLSYPKPYTLEWDMGNGYTTTDTMPTFVYFVPGDFDVSLTINNGFCESVKTKTITIEPVKTEEIAIEIPNLYTSIEEVNLYPNPNNGDFNLKIKLTNEALVHVELFDLMGKLIDQEKFTTLETTRNYSFEELKTGIYIVRVRTGKDSHSVKFVKINN